jgi:hypothetical protein
LPGGSVELRTAALLPFDPGAPSLPLQPPIAMPAIPIQSAKLERFLISLITTTPLYPYSSPPGLMGPPNDDKAA